MTTVIQAAGLGKRYRRGVRVAMVRPCLETSPIVACTAFATQSYCGLHMRLAFAVAAHPDERVRLRSVRVIPETDSGEPITVHTPLRIEFTYWNYVPDTILNVSMFLTTLEEDGVKHRLRSERRRRNVSAGNEDAPRASPT